MPPSDPYANGQTPSPNPGPVGGPQPPTPQPQHQYQPHQFQQPQVPAQQPYHPQAQYQPHHLQQLPNQPHHFQPPPQASHFQQPQPHMQQPAPHPAYAAEYGFHGQPHLPQAPVRRRGKGVLVAVLAVVLLAAGGGGAYAAMMANKPSPDKVFQKALEVSMSTKSMAVDIKSNDIDVDYKFDLSDVRKPKVSAKGTLKLPTGTLTLQGYDDAVSSYVRTSAEYAAGQTSILPGLQDSGWRRLRENGKLPDSYSQSAGMMRGMLDIVSDGHVGILGDLVAGNFSAQERAKLIDIANSKHVYTYDAKAVTKETLDGKDVFKYPVKVNTEAMKELVKQAAEITGASDEFLESTVGMVEEPSVEYTYYIGIDDGRLYKSVDADKDDKGITTYSGFDTTSIGSAPAPVVGKWDDEMPSNTGIVPPQMTR